MDKSRLSGCPTRLSKGFRCVQKSMEPSGEPLIAWMGSAGAQRQPQNTRNGVVDAHRAIIAGSSDPVTEGRHAREMFQEGLDGSYNGSPSIRTPVKLCDSGFLLEGHGAKHR
jgi:hypothetical protein